MPRTDRRPIGLLEVIRVFGLFGFGITIIVECFQTIGLHESRSIKLCLRLSTARLNFYVFTV